MSQTYKRAASRILDRSGEKSCNTSPEKVTPYLLKISDRLTKNTKHSNQRCKHNIGAPIIHPEAMTGFYEQENFPPSFFALACRRKLVLLVHIVDNLVQMKEEQKGLSLLGL